ncbi:MAG TPA: prolyl aminopeptidase [Burkholderiales bacterium]|nr:prolyl aminopeptidase [Burkholderiales bacterium]
MVADQNQAAGDILYPPLEPHHHGFLNVGGGHRIHFEQSGNPDGFPVLFIHGGPGSRSRPDHRRFFDAVFYRIVLFDQRGCGQSTPAGSLVENTTSHLVADIEKLRQHIGVDQWLIFGGSWGSTLGLAYAIAHADRVAGMVLRGVFLGGAAEVEWYLSGIRRFIPEVWGDFAKDAGDSVVGRYQRLIDHCDEPTALAAARRWCDYEARVMEPGNPFASGGAGAASEILARVKVQLHFLANDFFLRPNELLDNLWRMGNRPVIVVQGRLDMVCPPVTAWAVAQAIEGSELCMIEKGGHSALQPEIAAQLCAATRRMQACLRR